MFFLHRNRSEQAGDPGQGTTTNGVLITPRQYEVGDLFSGNRRFWPEAIQYNYLENSHELAVFRANLQPGIVRSVRTGPVEFALYIEQPVIMLLARFAGVPPFPGAVADGTIDWSGGPYNYWRVFAEQRTLPAPATGRQGQLAIVLVEATSGIIRLVRTVTMSEEFTSTLEEAIRQQAGLPWSAAVYDDTVDQLHHRYPTQAALAAASRVRCAVEGST